MGQAAYVCILAGMSWTVVLLFSWFPFLLSFLVLGVEGIQIHIIYMHLLYIYALSILVFNGMNELKYFNCDWIELD